MYTSALWKIFYYPPPPFQKGASNEAVFINRLGAQQSFQRFDSGVPALVFSTQWFNLLLTYLGKYD